LTQRSGPGGSIWWCIQIEEPLPVIIFGTEGYLAPEVLERTFIIEDEGSDTYFAIDVWLVEFDFVFIF
jgi:hypothetical protein